MERNKSDKHICRRGHQSITFAMGGNVAGVWGDTTNAFLVAAQRLCQLGLSHLEWSPVYRTKAYGQNRQPSYLNVVLLARSTLSARELLVAFKRLEVAAGRRNYWRNGERPLDIDLIDYGGRVVNWHAGPRRPKLVLPHPLMAKRAFVLVPLVDLNPHWRHPVYGLSARQLLIRLGGCHRLVRQGEICRLDSSVFPCNL